jgi:hypothetical protein
MALAAPYSRSSGCATTARARVQVSGIGSRVTVSSRLGSPLLDVDGVERTHIGPNLRPGDRPNVRRDDRTHRDEGESS